MAALRENAITRLATVSGVDLNGSAGTETSLYTVPTGKTAIITKVIVRTASASAASAVITLGKTGGTCDEFRGDQTLTNLDATNKYIEINLDQGTNDTPEGSETFVGGTDVFGVEITTAHGSSVTAVFDVWGYLI